MSSRLKNQDNSISLGKILQLNDLSNYGEELESNSSVSDKSQIKLEATQFFHFSPKKLKKSYADFQFEEQKFSNDRVKDFQ